MKKIFLLLILSMITACTEPKNSDTDTGTGTGTGASGSINKIDLYLGSTFTIDSFQGLRFKNQPGTLNYNIENITPVGQDASDIARDLRVALDIKLKNNEDSNYILGDHKITGSIDENLLLRITFPIELSANNGSGEVIRDTYAFNILFNNEMLPPLDKSFFSLGEKFIIDSLDGKPFTRLFSSHYFVEDIDHEGKTVNQIVFELKEAITVKLNENSTIDHKVGTRSILGTMGANKIFTIQFPITIKEKKNNNNTITSIYTFDIKFNNENIYNKLSFYLGEDFTVDALGDSKFTSIDNALMYEVKNVPSNFYNPELIKTQLKMAIDAVHKAVNDKDICFELADGNIATDEGDFIIIKFPIYISDKSDPSSSISGTYQFNITFSKVTSPIVIDFSLGDDFNIKSLNSKSFKITDNKSLKYYVENVDPKNRSNTEITNELNLKIRDILKGKYLDNFTLGTPIATEWQDSLKVEFPITITDPHYPTNKEDGIYTFTILFVETPPYFKINFYLGNRFTIDSIFDKYFTTYDDESLQYNIADIEKGSIDEELVAGEFIDAIKKELGKNSAIKFALDTSTKTSTDKQIVVEIPVEIKEVVPSDIVLNGIYVFTIKYKEADLVPLNFDLGDSFTINSIDSEKFIQDENSTLIYTVENISPKDKNRAAIKSELIAGIEATLDNRTGITYSIKDSSISGLGTIVAGEKVIGKVNVSMSQDNRPSNNITEEYNFTINFKKDTPPSLLLSFDLGDSFSIPTIGSKKFVGSGDLLSIYKVDDVTRTDDMSINNIHVELQGAIREQLNKNDNISYELGNDILETIGSVVDGGELTLKYNITISKKLPVNEMLDSADTIKSVYSFTIKFNEYTKPFEPNFYLGADFTINTLDGKNFISVSSEPLKYNASDITIPNKTADEIATELVVAITDVLNSDDTINHSLGDPEITGSITSNNSLTIRILATLTDNTNADNVVDSEYVFTITFLGDAWDGETFKAPILSEDNEYLLTHANELAWLAQQPSIDKNIRLIADINMNDKPFTGIKEFYGIFDGDNHSIKNLKIVSDTNTTALIQQITNDSTIKNLNINGASLTGTEYVAGLIGTVIGTSEAKIKLTLDNLTTSVSLSADKETVRTAGKVIKVGGFIAYVENVDLIVKNLSNYGSIKTANGTDCYVGGIIGHINSDSSTTVITNTQNTVDLEAISCSNIDYVGGIIGYSSNRKIEISKTYNTGLLKSINSIASHTHTYIGGIIGLNNGMESSSLEDTGITLTDTNNKGKIFYSGKESTSMGGLIGANISPNTTITGTFNNGVIETTTDNISNIGGVIGVNQSRKTTINNVFNTGATIFDATSNTVNAGGVIGVNNFYKENDDVASETIITKAQNSGNIKGTHSVGGIIGYNRINKTSITDSSNRENIDSRNGTAGGIIGLNNSNISVTNTYNRNKISGNTFIGGIIGESNNGNIVIKTTYNIGTISDNENGAETNKSAGGLIGYAKLNNDKTTPNTLTIAFSHSKGNINVGSGHNTYAGLIGSMTDTATPTYNSNYSSQITPTGNLTGYSGEYINNDEFNLKGKFKNWNFTDTWIIKSSGTSGHPTLINNPEAVTP